MHPEFVDNMKKCVNPKDKVNPNNPDNLEEISKSEIAAVHRFLVAEVKPFNQDVIAESQLRMLLTRPENIVYGKGFKKCMFVHRRCFLLSIHFSVKRTDTLPPLIERGKPLNFFILVIEGKAEMTFGPDEIPIEVGSFRTFGISVLNETKTTKEAKKTNNGWVLYRRIFFYFEMLGKFTPMETTAAYTFYLKIKPWLKGDYFPASKVYVLNFAAWLCPYFPFIGRIVSSDIRARRFYKSECFLKCSSFTSITRVHLLSRVSKRMSAPVMVTGPR